MTDKLYRIKPLVWEKTLRRACAGMGLCYAIFCDCGRDWGWYLTRDGHIIESTHTATKAEAKAACEAHWQSLMAQGLEEEVYPGYDESIRLDDYRRPFPITQKLVDASGVGG